MSKSKIVIGTLLVLSLGVLAGAFGTNMYYKYRMEQLFSQDEPPRVVHLFMKRLSDKLELTDQQRQEIETIVTQSHRELREVRSKFRPEVETIMKRAFADIEQELDEEQKQQFREFRERSRFFRGRKGGSGTRLSKSLDHMTQRFLTTVDRELPLDQEQRLQVHQIVKSHVAEMRETLKGARERGLVGTGEVRKSLEHLNRQTEDRLRVILTQEELMTYNRIWREQRQELWVEMTRKRHGRINGEHP